MSERKSKKPSSLLLSHWDQVVREASVTPLSFYELVLQGLAERSVPHNSVSYVSRREGGLMSARRLYLRVRFRRLIFDIGAMRFGDTLTVSSWLHQTPPGVLDLLFEIPGLRFLLRRYVQPVTFYRFDTTAAFQRLVHDCILDAVAQISTAKAIRGIPAQADRPILKEFYNQRP